VCGRRKKRMGGAREEESEVGEQGISKRFDLYIYTHIHTARGKSKQ
jgi:hypothetical protein